MSYLETYTSTFFGMINWIWNQIAFNIPIYENYFYGLFIISLIVLCFEFLFPWRKNQKLIRKDFWIDGFYIYFNCLIFTTIIGGMYSLFNEFYEGVGLSNTTFRLINLDSFNSIFQLLIFFILIDFVQWSTHVLLHRFDFLWKFHKVHHSVTEMGFSAHFRFHWMEHLFYKPLKTLVIMLIGGFEPSQAYIVHFVAITIGHINHANIRITYGPLKYILNNPVMHLYHHAKKLPKDKRYGVNFGISLSLWDYIFRTNYIPQSKDGNYDLGFDGIESFPRSFWKQLYYGFSKK
jgi:sterol desaturase/sphingolipid hydroxylase (fatty acid hydroxylase superfamily)